MENRRIELLLEKIENELIFYQRKVVSYDICLGIEF